jgi:hypothetical protein
MGWFSDVFSLETLVPIAAGVALPGIGGILAGSALSGAMAASRGEDFLGGAIKGGLGAYTGQSLGSAFNPASAGSGIAKAGTQGATTGAGLSTPSSATQMFQAAGDNIMGTTAPSSFASFNPVSPFQQAGSGAQALSNSSAFANFQPSASFAPASNAMQPAFGEAGREAIAGASGFGNTASALGTGFKQGVQNLGGGSSLVGAGKLASTGLGLAGMAGLDQAPMTMEEDDRGKYDPNATLNLSGDTGLRLIASGGYIGKRNYADGGYLEGGPAEGDGMSDDIPATIDETQPAALSEGEFVIPADVVAFAGNGSSDAGARRFYEMMEQIRRDATGRPEQIREIDVEDYMPYSSESRSF